MLYAANLILIGAFSTAMWAYGYYRGRLTSPDVTPQEARSTLLNGLAPVVSFLPSLLIAPFDPGTAMLSWLLTIPISAGAERLGRQGTGTPQEA
ncbi:hypothetical protein [Pseudonocardia sp. ICBG601]|nr:hypothetical protein [Pseudonocardia sp. ICBG601]